MLHIILLIVMLLGGLLHQGAKVCPIGSKQIALSANINKQLTDYLFSWAVKLEETVYRLLNIVYSPKSRKELQTNFIYTDIHTFWS